MRCSERSCPTAIWQTEIFTFHLKRVHAVCIIGVIDNHSHYVAGCGPLRRQGEYSALGKCNM